MIDRKFKLRWRRRLRHSRKQVEDLGYQAEEQLERHFFRRLSRIVQVRRFVAAWVLLMILLAGVSVVQLRSLGDYYQKLVPTTGGSFTEGIVGAFTNANPIYATSAVDASVSKLVFSGLFKYDQYGHLAPDLAQSWKSDAAGRIYRVRLKDNLLWHDNLPLTAEDVAFTYQTIENPDVKSPLFNGWQGIKVTAVDRRTVQFVLPNTLSSFIYSLTNGIVPKHILQTTAPEQLRTSTFNSVNPIGSGPFRWSSLQVIGNDNAKREERISLLANADYHSGAPKLQHYIVQAFHDPKQLEKSLANKELNLAVGLDAIPGNLKNNDSFQTASSPLNAQVMVFFKSASGLLSDKKLRQALVLGADRSAIINSLGYPLIPADSPFLRSQFAYNHKQIQKDANATAAADLLTADGWKLDSTNGGIRTKHGNKLGFTVVSERNSEYSEVALQLQNQWRKLGVDMTVKLLSGSELQGALGEHQYDALLYGISLGPDPDVFAYWDSSQALARSDNRLNFSEYSSSVADASLESGRTRLGNKLRIVKYQPFVKAWLADYPALALYQPQLSVITYGTIYGLDMRAVNSALDRYSQVDQWMIRQARVYK